MTAFLREEIPVGAVFGRLQHESGTVVFGGCRVVEHTQNSPAQDGRIVVESLDGTARMAFSYPEFHALQPVLMTEAGREAIKTARAQRSGLNPARNHGRN